MLFIAAGLPMMEDGVGFNYWYLLYQSAFRSTSGLAKISWLQFENLRHLGLKKTKA